MDGYGPVRDTGLVGDPSAALADAGAAALAPVLGPVVVVPGERLPSSDRAVVLRAVATDRAGRSHRVVLKAPIGSGLGSAREEAALGLVAAAQVPGVVRLLATSTDPALLVLADVGDGPTLADRLLADDPVAAETAVLEWAARLASLQAATGGLQEEFASRLAALSPLGHPLVDTSREAVDEACAALARDLPRLGVPMTAGALEELRELAVTLDVTAPGAPGALVPGDTCPSNAVDSDNGMVLLDFEGAEYRHLAWEAAYLTVPWPSCWCSWRLPDSLAARALTRWQQAVAPAFPVVATPSFQDDLIRATLGWVFISTGWFLAAALDGDPPPPDPGRRHLMPTRRALLQHRLRLAAQQETTLLPTLRELADQTLTATLRQWGTHPLPLARAFQ